MPEIETMRQKVLACAVDLGSGDPANLISLRQAGFKIEHLHEYDVERDSFVPTDESRLFRHASDYFDLHHSLITPEVLRGQMEQRHVPVAVVARYVTLINTVKELPLVRPGDVPYIVQRLKDYYAHHNATNILIASADLLRDGKVEEAMSLVQSRSSELLVERRDVEPTRTYADVAKERWQLYQERLANPFIGHGVYTGFHDFDKETGGLYGGDLLVIAGLPKQGKTAMLLTIVKNMVNTGSTVVFASGEMATSRIWERLDAAFTGLIINQIREASLNEDDQTKYLDFLRGVKKQLAQVAVIPPDRCANMNTIREEMQAIMLRQPVGALVIDYIQIVEPGVRTQNAQDWQMVGQTAVEMSRLGHQCGIPVVSASQVPEDKAKKVDDPFMGLARARSIGHTAASVWRIWKDETMPPDEMMVMVSASRHGRGNFSFPIHADFARMQIAVRRDIEDLEEERL